MVMLGGGKVVEAGYANECTPAQLAARITANTAAILYIKSHHAVQRSVLSLAQAVEVARQHNIPLILDAAAEEDLRSFYQEGADLVIYSGAKAIEGPSSGLVVGKKRYVEWVKKQSLGIGRAMKVGKEGILGLTRAIDLYLAGQGESGQEMVQRMEPFIGELNDLPGISAKVIWDSAGRDIARTEITVDAKAAGMSALELVQKLKQGSTAIFFREYRANEGRIEVDVRSVSSAQLTTISQQIKNQIKGSNSCS
ncbi:MAG: SelA-like pyridoxal phosphate-dependent enzyme, partial [Enterobacteriaceae bacterium]